MKVQIGETKPPAPHTEASLLSAMEHAGKIVDEESVDIHETEFGIGTPATRAATIEKLIEKQMVFRKGRALIPREYGIRLIAILPEFLRSPEMTGEWEARLSRISKGSDDPDQFIADIKEQVLKLIQFAIDHVDSDLKNADTVGTCPLCGQKVKEYPDAYYCVNKECDFRKIWKAKKGFHPTLKVDTMRLLLQDKKAETDKGFYTLIDAEPYDLDLRKLYPLSRCL